jgi:hypothetical protein
MIDQMTRDDLDRIGAAWIDRIKRAEKRDSSWRKAAERAETAYLVDDEGDGADVPEFNILHANVETLRPNIYNSTPSPDIRARHNSDDDVAKRGADILERAIAAMIDDDRLDAEEEAVVLDAEVAGRGVLRLRYDLQEDVSGQPVNELVVYENVAWRDYLEGDARRWSDVPWVAFGHYISEDRREQIEDPEIAKHYTQDDADPEREEKTVRVWEIWCKEKREVLFVVEDSARVLSIKPDPFGLQGFFPMPQPVQPITATGKRTPVCPYSVYEKQAGELDRITKRIRGIVSGLKVRGLIAGGIEDVQELAALGDNQLKPVANVENLMAAGGLEKAVMWWPVETAVAVLRELFLQRDQVKQTIYEITGISDIVRGQGQASETATAQEIKARAGSLRVKHRQRLVERHVRDTFQITAEIMAKKWEPASIERASGMRLDEQTAMLLKDPAAWYRIDVESDSTIRADMMRNREEMARFLEGTGQFFSTMAPLAQSDPSLVEPMTQMYSSFARQYNLGAEAEAALDRMAEAARQAAGQPKPNPEMEKIQAEMQLKQQEAAFKAQELEIRKVEARAQMQAAEFDRKQATVKAMTERAKARTDRMKAESEIALREAELEEKLADMSERREAEKRRLDYDIDRQKQDYEYKVEEIATAAMSVIGPAVEEMKAEIQAQGERQQAEMAAMAQNVMDAMGQIAAAQSAPKEIIRENGRVVGTRSTYDGPADGIAAPVVEALTRERRIDGDMVN